MNQGNCKKFTHGFVTQTFVDGKCVSQEFTAGDDVAHEDQFGDSLIPGINMVEIEYQPFTMEQPEQVSTDGVKFICPDCKGTRLECCEDGAYNSEVLNIDADGDFDFGEINASGSPDRFQCLGCGFVLMGVADGDAEHNFLSPYAITEHEEVVEWCKENCKQE